MPTIEEARAAIATLIDYGRSCYCPTAKVRVGDSIGMAVARCTDAVTCADAAFVMLEDWNGHLSAACIDAIERGRGEVDRQGRRLTITLPTWWNDKKDSA